jgi:predicted lipoprotein with Yx(FWY)xxD motif
MEQTVRSRFSTGLAIIALGTTLAACGGGATTSPTTPAPAQTTAAATSPAATSPAAAVDLKTAAAAPGQIVVDGRGRSVYFFTNDVKDSGKSACEGACVALWPAVTTTSDTPKAEGVTGTLGTIPTSDGKKQLTLNGMPVYTYSLDTAAGDIKGQGFNDLWYLVNPAGEMIKPPGRSNSGY